MRTAVLLCALLWSLVDSQPPAPYVSFNEVNLPNHSYVDLSLVGDTVDGGDSVQCHTDLTSCCTSGMTNAVDRPDWYFPGSITFGVGFSSGGGDIYQARGAQRNDLRRRNNATTPSGIYRCEIPTDDGNGGFMRETVYVGIYSSGGDVTIPGGITAMISGDEFTLTCISTGGPATTVTWTRDSVTVTEGTETVLDDPVTAEYTHTLTGSTVGDYRCTVTNDISSDTATLTVQVVDPPTNVMAERASATSILVSWSPPDPQGDTTGYRIDYTSIVGDGGSVDVDGGGTIEQELTGLLNGAIYTISIVAISQGLPSESVVAIDAVHLVPDEPIVSVDTRTPTSTSLSWTISSDSVVTGYRVMWERDISLGCPEPIEGSATTISSTTSFTIDELEEDSSYDITVTATNAAGNSEDTVTAITEESAPTAAPTSVRTSSDSSSSITVQWEMVPCIHRNGVITGYSVQYGIQGQSNPQSKPVTGADTLMTTITDLMPSTTYTIQVAAVNGDLIGMYSEGEVQQTNDVISMVSVVPSSPTTLTVSWTVDVGVMVESYTITYSNTDTDCFHDSDDTTDIDDDETMYTLTGLEEGTEYSITVTALLAGGDTGEAEGMGTTTPAAPSEPPSNVGATSTSSTITVQWEMVPCIHRNGDITGYSVQYTGGRSTQTMSVPGGDTLMTTIEGVMSSTNYSIEVAAVNDNLIGKYSDPVIVETLQSVFLSLNDVIIPNHGYVEIGRIGSTPSTGLICNTNRPATFMNNVGDPNSGGNWFAPDMNSDDVPGFRRNRGPMVVSLYRETATDPAEGIYHCVIEDDTFTEQTLYVGLYNSGGGSIMSSEVVSLTVVSDLNGPNPQFTLTCISTGGPATTITWTRGSQTAVGERRSDVVNGVTAQYTHTLTVTGRLEGLYTCTVTNEVTPAGASDTFTVEVASAPTDVVAMQVNITSVRVSWSPSDPLGDTTGYIVSYNNSTVTIADSSTDNLILTGLVMEASYTISIVATSDHFNSEAMQDEVTLVLPPVEPTVEEVVELGSTTISLSWTVSDDSVVTGSLVMWEIASTGGSSARAVRDDGSGSSGLLGRTIRSYTIRGLRSSTSYLITVTLINPAGNSSLQVTLSTTEAKPGTDSSTSTISLLEAIIGEVVLAVIAMVVIVIVIVVLVMRKHRVPTEVQKRDDIPIATNEAYHTVSHAKAAEADYEQIDLDVIPTSRETTTDHETPHTVPPSTSHSSQPPIAGQV